MAKRRFSLLILTNFAGVYTALASAGRTLARQDTLDLRTESTESIPNLPNRHREVFAQAPGPNTGNVHATPHIPTATRAAGRDHLLSSPSTAYAITEAPRLDAHRRRISSQAVMIVLLSSALASANNDALSISQRLASSISQLQSSAALFASSASSAILAAQASASDAVLAAEVSASEAVSAAEESASSRVSSALAIARMATALAPATETLGTTYAYHVGF